MKYQVTIYWSEEDSLYLAEVPDLPGCVTHGSTYQEAAANADDAMSGWLKAWAAMGREIPKPRQRALTA